VKEGSFKILNDLGAKGTPFVFFLSYKKDRLYYAVKEEWVNNADLLFNFPNQASLEPQLAIHHSPILEYTPPSLEVYQTAFNKVKKALHYGDTYLLNLTFESKVKSNLSLRDLYPLVNAKFKALFLKKYLFFSPEIFVQIEDNILSTYPMKGTIDAQIPKAEESLLQNKKEMAEHNTIVDLLRNDISIVGQNTIVEKYRYIDELNTHKGSLLQASSKISTELQSNWQSQIGDIIDAITPAGSISGAPKARTCELIDEIEDYQRGFYTGICGIFDGECFNSGVMIRFLERKNNGDLVFKSGGGIHHLSTLQDEYDELIQKIYLPI
jgi:para-aminobenzoate synthetase component 1